MKFHTTGEKFVMIDRIHGGNLDPRQCKSNLPRDASKLWAKRWALTITAFQYARVAGAELQVTVVEFVGSRVPSMDYEPAVLFYTTVDLLGHLSLKIDWLGEAALKVRLEPR